MSERYAPAGKVWLCMMCGKTAKDYCAEERGWDESCALNCILVDEATKRPTEEQVREFGEARQRRLGALTANIASLRRSIREGDASDIDPELLKLAQEAIDRRNAAATPQEEQGR